MKAKKLGHSELGAKAKRVIVSSFEGGYLKKRGEGRG